MFVDNLPAAPRVGIGGHPLEHQSGGAVGKRTIDDIGVTGNPADISRTPINVTVLVVENVFVADGRVQQIACRTVLHTLGFTGRARGVENKERILRFDDLWLTRLGLIGGEVRIPNVSTLLPAYVAAGAFDRDDGMHIGAGS